MASKDYEIFSKKERKEIEKEIKYLEDEQLIWNTKASAMGTRIGKGYAKGGEIEVGLTYSEADELYKIISERVNDKDIKKGGKEDGILRGLLRELEGEGDSELELTEEQADVLFPIIAKRVKELSGWDSEGKKRSEKNQEGGSEYKNLTEILAKLDGSFAKGGEIDTERREKDAKFEKASGHFLDYEMDIAEFQQIKDTDGLIPAKDRYDDWEDYDILVAILGKAQQTLADYDNEYGLTYYPPYEEDDDEEYDDEDYAKGGTTETRIYAIDPTDARVQDISYINELPDDEFMFEAEEQGYVWSSWDSFIDSNEFNDDEWAKKIIHREIKVGNVHYAKGGYAPPTTILEERIVTLEKVLSLFPSGQVATKDEKVLMSLLIELKQEYKMQMHQD